MGGILTEKDVEPTVKGGAVQLPREALGEKLSGLIIGQNGKSSTLNGWLPAAVLGAKVVDAFDDGTRIDDLMLEIFPDNESVTDWIALARKNVPFAGLPARIAWLGHGRSRRHSFRRRPFRSYDQRRRHDCRRWNTARFGKAGACSDQRYLAWRHPLCRCRL